MAQSDAKCVAVIPARGGSKRVPRKNVREFMGKPMIAYTIQAALESQVFDRVVVSTDDDEITEVSRDYGAEVPFRRSDDLADDYTPISKVTADALNQIDDDYAYVAQLMANCPLRTAEDMVASFRNFEKKDHDTQLSVFEYGWQNPWWALELEDNGRLAPLFEEMLDEDVRSQDQSSLYCPTGAVWWGKTDVIRQVETFHIDGRAGWVMPWKRAVDIDTEEDWQFAEILAREQK